MDIPTRIALYVVFLVHVVCHEASHAWMALRFGDRTAEQEGLVTVNPVPHIRQQPFGMVLLPLIGVWMGFLIGFGQTPIRPDRMRPRRAGMLVTAGVGPIVNLLISVACIVLIRVLVAAGIFQFPAAPGYFWSLVEAAPGASQQLQYLARILSLGVALGVILFVFNLVPIPPLDGGTVLRHALPRKAGETYRRIVRQGGFILFIVLIIYFPKILRPFMEATWWVMTLGA